MLSGEPTPELEVLGYLLKSMNQPTEIKTLQAFLLGRLGPQTFNSVYDTLALAVQVGLIPSPASIPESAWSYVPLFMQILQLEIIK